MPDAKLGTLHAGMHASGRSSPIKVSMPCCWVAGGACVVVSQERKCICRRMLTLLPSNTTTVSGGWIQDNEEHYRYMYSEREHSADTWQRLPSSALLPICDAHVVAV